jgi:UTP:GlnB (protein PII) uridylyltransferase
MAMTRPFTKRPTRRGPVIELAADHARPVEQRRGSVIALLGAETRTTRRVHDAPAGYLLTHGAADVARHCQLLEPRPSPGEIRLAVTPARTGWHVDVASRDRPGLLAAVTGVLAAHGLNVAQAVVATWDDGAALQAFIIDPGTAPDTLRLQHDLEVSLSTPLSAPPVNDAIVDFDDHVSPWYTRCDIRANDRTGLLHALAVAVASAGADIHAARAVTVNGTALDRFDLTDWSGNKLTPALQDSIRAHMRG